jgi:hypothetical protein
VICISISIASIIAVIVGISAYQLKDLENRWHTAFTELEQSEIELDQKISDAQVALTFNGDEVLTDDAKAFVEKEIGRQIGQQDKHRSKNIEMAQSREDREEQIIQMQTQTMSNLSTTAAIGGKMLDVDVNKTLVELQQKIKVATDLNREELKVVLNEAKKVLANPDSMNEDFRKAILALDAAIEVLPTIELPVPQETAQNSPQSAPIEETPVTTTQITQEAQNVAPSGNSGTQSNSQPAPSQPAPQPQPQPVEKKAAVDVAYYNRDFNVPVIPFTGSNNPCGSDAGYFNDGGAQMAGCTLQEGIGHSKVYLPSYFYSPMPMWAHQLAVSVTAHEFQHAYISEVCDDLPPNRNEEITEALTVMRYGTDIQVSYQFNANDSAAAKKVLERGQKGLKRGCWI